MIVTSKWIIRNLLTRGAFNGVDFISVSNPKYFNSREIAKNTLSTNKDILKGIYLIEEVFIKE